MLVLSLEWRFRVVRGYFCRRLVDVSLILSACGCTNLGTAVLVSKSRGLESQLALLFRSNFLALSADTGDKLVEAPSS